MPKISVIVPVYNVEAYLPQCIDSIRKQTFTDIEIVCVNDVRQIARRNSGGIRQARPACPGNHH